MATSKVTGQPPAGAASGRSADLDLVDRCRRGELGAFEDVRQVSGHLSAERMASDAVARLRALLRAGDRLHQLDDDRFGIVINVTDPNQVEALCRRMSASLDDLPVPRRANQVRPLIRSAMAGAIAVDAEMAGLLNGFEPSQLRRAG